MVPTQTGGDARASRGAHGTVDAHRASRTVEYCRRSGHARPDWSETSGVPGAEQDQE